MSVLHTRACFNNWIFMRYESRYHLISALKLTSLHWPAQTQHSERFLKLQGPLHALSSMEHESKLRPNGHNSVVVLVCSCLALVCRIYCHYCSKLRCRVEVIVVETSGCNQTWKGQDAKKHKKLDASTTDKSPCLSSLLLLIGCFSRLTLFKCV